MNSTAPKLIFWQIAVSFVNGLLEKLGELEINNGRLDQYIISAQSVF